jgi:hypothetical protein
MFQNPLIMYTLVHAHLVEYGNDIPASSKLQDEMKPVGALILSLQAVSASHFKSPASDIFSHRLNMNSRPGKRVNVAVMAQQVHDISHQTTMVIAQ